LKRYKFCKIKTFAAICRKTEKGSGTFLTDRFADGRGQGADEDLIGQRLLRWHLRTLTKGARLSALRESAKRLDFLSSAGIELWISCTFRRNKPDGLLSGFENNRKRKLL
jgi:hypothetical protein